MVRILVPPARAEGVLFPNVCHDTTRVAVVCVVIRYSAQHENRETRKPPANCDITGGFIDGERAK